MKNLSLLSLVTRNKLQDQSVPDLWIDLLDSQNLISKKEEPKEQLAENAIDKRCWDTVQPYVHNALRNSLLTLPEDIYVKKKGTVSDSAVFGLLTLAGFEKTNAATINDIKEKVFFLDVNVLQYKCKPRLVIISQAGKLDGNLQY